MHVLWFETPVCCRNVEYYVCYVNCLLNGTNMFDVLSHTQECSSVAHIEMVLYHTH